MARQSIKVFLGLFLASVLLIASVHSAGSENLDNNNENDSDDLETAEFFIWPKLLLAKAALGKSFAYTKTVQVQPAPVVTYSYKPVTYTAYKWVPVPYQYTVQQPYVEKTIASSSNVATPVSAGVSTVVRAPGVSVDVVKSGGLVSVNTGVGATSSSGSSSSDSSIV